MVFGWENSLGLLAFLSLIPLIILYIVKPKPREIEVPSLMFFMKTKTHHAKQSFFQKLLHNWLFLLQLLILFLLSLYFIEPYTTLGGTTFAENSILIVDTSASTQANNNAIFEEVIQKARDHLGKTNTLILVSNTPRTVLKQASKKEAEKYLKSLEPTDSRSSIGESISLAEKHLTGEDDAVIIISDFHTTSTTDLQLAKETLQQKVNTVLFKQVTIGKTKNIGIIDLQVGEEESSITVKNYNTESATVPIQIGTEEKTIVLPANSVETYSFTTPSTPTEIKLQVQDDFHPDNTAYITLPQEKQVKVLLISDEPSFYLKTAITSANNIQLDVTGSSSFIDGYDVYIIGAVRELRTSILNKLEQGIQEGKQIIIHLQENSATLNYGTLLPVTLGGFKGQSIITTEQLTKFTKDISFGSIERYYGATQPQGIVIATAENNAVISLKPQGKGNVVYYGILEDKSDFKLSPSYPIFWTKLVTYLAQAEDLNDVNIPTGSILALTGEQEVKTPTKKLLTDIIIFEERGIYTVGSKTYAASLKSDLESDLQAPTPLQEEKEMLTEKGNFKYPLATTIIILLCILLFIELLATKIRGEI